MTEPYRVVTEDTGWSYIEGPDGKLSGPWRYRWEAEEEADALNHGKGMSDGFTITGCDGHCLANGCARQELRAEIERLTTALAKQTEQQAYPCSPHCAGYLRELSARAEIERLQEKLHYANGTCDLAMKHRDAAEAENERLQALVLKAASWLEDEGAISAGVEIRAALAGREGE